MAKTVADDTRVFVSDEKYFEELFPALSPAARRLWGKTDKDNQDQWLPLFVHLADTAAIAEFVWDLWLPASSKNVIVRSLILEGYADDEGEALQAAKKLFMALAAAHDIGKATPAFQANAKYHQNTGIIEGIRESGLPYLDQLLPGVVKHALASQGIVERNGWSRNISVIVGGHHGKPPSLGMVQNAFDGYGYPSDTGFSDRLWINTQNELLGFALSLVGMEGDNPLFKVSINRASQVVLTGLLIIADWLSSGVDSFQYIGFPLLPGAVTSSRLRAVEAWESLDWPEPWCSTEEVCQTGRFEGRFGFRPRPVQESVIEALSDADEPGLVIIEAPTGEGKTEAALAATEIVAAKRGCGGAFVALPTQATSNGMFPRIRNWIEALGMPSHSIYLAHGKAQFNKDYIDLAMSRPSEAHLMQIGIDDNDPDWDHGLEQSQAAVYVDDWFQGRKKGILADYVVGTIDQILMAGLMQRHLALRHLALTNKVVIIDECHAYDAYMSSYLYQVLAWLGEYRVPTIILSATLPKKKRQELVDAYLSKPSARKTTAVPWKGISSVEAIQPDWAETIEYPLITYTNSDEVFQLKPVRSPRSTKVAIERIDDSSLMAELQTLLIEGGCVGIIANTVARAQGIARLCKEAFGEERVVLFHSQFIAPDRIAKEDVLREQLGPPADNTQRPDMLIVVGTQVLEQSLDIDFDVLFTDICPMDLLIQRIGRTHRHIGRKRPATMQQARCYVISPSDNDGFDSGSVAVYGEYMLMNTDLLLPGELNLPDDVSRLVNEAYSDEGLESLSRNPADYSRAKDEFERKIKEQHKNAAAFQVSPPLVGNTLVGWLDTEARDRDDKYGKRGEATVRDSGDSIEVLAVQRKADGGIYLLPWIERYGGSELSLSDVPDPEIAKAASRCSVKLPSIFSSSWAIGGTITELERSNINVLPGCWQESQWLQGELFLILDEEFRAELCGFELHYSRSEGLSIEREDYEH